MGAPVTHLTVIFWEKTVQDMVTGFMCYGEIASA
jgi:hypothetical protein